MRIYYVVPTDAYADQESIELQKTINLEHFNEYDLYIYFNYIFLICMYHYWQGIN